MTTHTRQIDGVILGRAIARAHEYSEYRYNERRRKRNQRKLLLIAAALLGGAFLL